MTRAPILIRVDAARTKGWESFWRCLVCAGALQRRRRPTFFLSQLDPPDLANSVRRGGNEWIEASHELGSVDDLDETLENIRRLSPAAVVVDGANANGGYLRALRATGILVVSIDHLAHTNFPSQLIVNPLLGPAKDAYEFGNGAQLLMGTRYALVRPEMRRLRPLRSQEPAQPFRALVALGDDDLPGQSIELAKMLLASSRLSKVDVVIRAHHPGREVLQGFAQGSAGQVEVAIEPSEVATRMTRCHFAVTAGNSWSLEMACVGIPQLLVVQDEAHWPTAQRLEEEGAAACLGWHETVSAGTIREAINNLLDDPTERQALARCGRQLIDGRGPDRFVTALEVMLHPSRRIAAEAALAA